MVSVHIGGILFEGWPSNFDRCFLIGRNGLKGWRGGDLRREEIPRPAAHGAFDAPGFQAQRVITLEGSLLASSPGELQHMKDRVSGLLADGSLGRMTVDDDWGTSWRDVRLVSIGDMDEIGDTECPFSLTLWAADPRRYGEVNEFAAGEAALTRGNFPARPQLIVSGTAAGGYTVTGPGGRQVVVTEPLVSGQPHTIDFARGGLWIGGVRQLRAITVYEPWEIGPGLPGATATVDNGASLIQRVTDTFV